MGFFDLNLPQRTGLFSIDVDAQNKKVDRLNLSLAAGVTTKESKPNQHDWKVGKVSDPLNAMTLKTETQVGMAPRGGYGSWTFAFPAVYNKKDGGWRPLFAPQTEDKDFELFGATVVGATKGIPDGARGICVATGGHGSREKMIFLGDHGNDATIISDWLSISPPDYSTHIFDMAGTTPDPNRHAGFHTFTRVRKWGDPCKFGSTTAAQKYVVALNGTQSADKTGGLFASFNTNDALLSEHYFGPLGACSRKDHTVAVGDVDIRSGRINTNALYGGGSHREGPLRFEEVDMPTTSEGPHAHIIHRQWNPNYERGWVCGKRKGRWEEWVGIDVVTLPKCNPTKTTTLDANSNPREKFAQAAYLYTSDIYMSRGISFAPSPAGMIGPTHF